MSPAADARAPEANYIFEFHLEEFRQLRAEILQLARIQTQLEVFTVIAVALIFAFLAANERLLGDRAGVRFLIWWAPIFIVFTGYTLSRSLVRRAYQIGAYLRRLEKQMAFDGQGWEHSLQPEGGRRRRAVSPAKRLFWLVLTLLTLATSAVFASPGFLARIML
jgi:hypothetical protein